MSAWLQLRSAGGPTIKPWLAISTGSLLRTAYHALPEFERLHSWLYRQHSRLGDRISLAQLSSSRPYPAFWRSEAFVETLFNIKHGQFQSTVYTHELLSIARQAAAHRLSDQPSGVGLQ
eukprot:6235159-Pyramimonas_sp.AAC.1